MDIRNIIFLIVVSFLLFGTACAQKNISDFQIDDSYVNADNGTAHALYLNEKQDSGITVYKYLACDDDDAHDNLIHDDGRDYLTPDDDFQMDKKSDNTVNFTDIDHAQHGVAEVVKCDGEDFVVVFWAKDTSSVNDKYLTSLLKEFNNDNDVSAIEF